MSDEPDNDLKRLFAEAAERPADEAFVQGVRVGMAGARWRALALVAAGYAAVALVAGGSLALLAPWLWDVLATGAAAVEPATAVLGASTSTVVVVLALTFAGFVVLSALRGGADRRT